MSWVCICTLRYAACKAHAPYCHLWTVHLFSILAHYLINGEKKVVTEQKTCVSIFSTTFVWKISHSENWAKYDQKCILVFVWCTVILARLQRTSNFLDWFSKNAQISDVRKIRPEGAELFLAGQTDGRTYMTKLTVAFCNFANASNKTSFSVQPSDYTPCLLSTMSFL
jgi:hypothetical protein